MIHLFKNIAMIGLVLLMFTGCFKESKTKGPDEVNFPELVWDKGGFNGSNAVLTDALIGNLNMNSKRLSYSWVGNDLSLWGYAHTQADGRTCVFYKKDGQWHGGFYEWVSSSRLTRDFTNIKTKYKNWDWNDIPDGAEAAVVIVSKNGTKRTNVLKGKWQK